VQTFGHGELGDVNPILAEYQAQAGEVGGRVED